MIPPPPRSYVKARGRRAAVLRAVWRDAPRSYAQASAWQITSACSFQQRTPSVPSVADRFLARPAAFYHSCSVDRLRGRAAEEVVEVAARIAWFAWAAHGVSAAELAADFVRDEGGQLWLLQARPLPRTPLDTPTDPHGPPVPSGHGADMKQIEALMNPCAVSAVSVR